MELELVFSIFLYPIRGKCYKYRDEPAFIRFSLYSNLGIYYKYQVEPTFIRFSLYSILDIYYKYQDNPAFYRLFTTSKQSLIRIKALNSHVLYDLPPPGSPFIHINTYKIDIFIRFPFLANLVPHYYPLNFQIITPQQYYVSPLSDF